MSVRFPTRHNNILRNSFLLLFAYRSYLNFMTEELRDPYVNLPRAIYISLPLVTVIYLLANMSYLAVLGPVGVTSTEAIAVVRMFACTIKLPRVNLILLDYQKAISLFYIIILIIKKKKRLINVIVYSKFLKK